MFSSSGRPNWPEREEPSYNNSTSVCSSSCTFEKLTLRLLDVTGSPTSKTALIGVYDIFGFTPQTFQGADRLAASLNGFVLLPDFFQGEPLSLSLYPPNTDEKKKTVGEFMQGKASIPPNTEKLVEVVKEAKGKYTGVEGWGVYGLCWGGKVRRLNLLKDTSIGAMPAHGDQLRP